MVTATDSTANPAEPSGGGRQPVDVVGAGREVRPTSTGDCARLRLDLAATSLGLDVAVLVAWARRDVLPISGDTRDVTVAADDLVELAATRAELDADAVPGLRDAIAETIRHNDPTPTRVFLDIMARAGRNETSTNPTFTGAVNDTAAAALVARHPTIAEQA